MDRSISRLATAGAAALIAACATAPESPESVLDARLAGPCDRLILSWPEDVSRLQAMMGGRFEPSTHNGGGRLQFRVVQCGATDASQSPLRFAHLSVAISADSVPVVITRMPNDGWAWLPFVIADNASSGVFAAMRYDTVPAVIEFDVDSATSGTLVTAQLTFDAGRISIHGESTGEAKAHTANTALVSEDALYHSVFFGEETAKRIPVTADITIEGRTPLSSIDEEPPEKAVLDTNLQPDRIYWRLPWAEQ